ncbi:hypothetical protein [Terasakiella pusilla]|uniref:hypothetical protein n=1 Tax=Terasakiella pusilla TaxID=64973 RepID=UPI003AA925AF
MPSLDLYVQKLSAEMPVVELKAVAQSKDGVEAETIFAKGASGEWAAKQFPDFNSIFDLNDVQANDVRICLENMVLVFVHGDREAGYNSMLQCSTSLKYRANLSWDEV